jgi:hypothetical protein
VGGTYVTITPHITRCLYVLPVRYAAQALCVVEALVISRKYFSDKMQVFSIC